MNSVPCPVHEAGRNSLRFKTTAVTLPTRFLSHKSVTSKRRSQQAPRPNDASPQVLTLWEHLPQLNYFEFIHWPIIRNFLSISKGDSATLSILSRWNNQHQQLNDQCHLLYSWGHVYCQNYGVSVQNSKGNILYKQVVWRWLQVHKVLSSPSLT